MAFSVPFISTFRPNADVTKKRPGTIDGDYTLNEKQELRFEVDGQKPLDMILLSGHAEIFGDPLVINKVYSFPPGAKVSVFTLSFCQIKLEGRKKNPFVVKESPMVTCKELHLIVEKLRLQTDKELANENNIRGPFVLVAGMNDVRKSVICRTLLNYGVHEGRTPVFVNLNMASDWILPPESRGAAVVEKPLPPADGFIDVSPIDFGFRGSDPSADITTYNVLISEMRRAVDHNLVVTEKVAASGGVINTWGCVYEDGYKSLLHASQAFGVDVIIVVEMEDLYQNLRKVIPFVDIIYVAPEMRQVSKPLRTVQECADNRYHPYMPGPASVSSRVGHPAMLRQERNNSRRSAVNPIVREWNRAGSNQGEKRMWGSGHCPEVILSYRFPCGGEVPVLKNTFSVSLRVVKGD